MNSPRVSVLIPTYEYARFLPEAIESVLAQDFQDFELIIADDASKDNTVEVCRTYTERDSRIRFVRHERNLGLVDNWNWCLRQARGKYIKFLFADDRLNHPSALRRLVDVLEQHPEMALVTSSRLIINAQSNPISLKNGLGRKDHGFSREQILRCCFSNAGHNNLIGEPSAVLFRREQAVREFNREYQQLVDLEMWFHLLQFGQLYYIGDPLCCFRKHAEQQTEVNRKLGLYLLEPLNLFAAYNGREDKRVLFRQLHIMRKKVGEKKSPAIAQVQSRFARTEYAVEYLRYRLLCPWFNMRRSLRKRIRLIGICMNDLMWRNAASQVEASNE